MSWDSINTKIAAITTSVNALTDAANAAKASIESVVTASGGISAANTQLGDMVVNAARAQDAVFNLGEVE